MSSDTIVVALATVMAAIIGALANSFFRREPKPTRPQVIFDTFESQANIDSIGLKFESGFVPQSKILLKSFRISNESDETITDLIVEYKNLRKKEEEFHTLNDPSSGLLESHYEVAFHPTRQTLRYVFNCLPPRTKFEGIVTINDFIVGGGFHASSQQAELLSSRELANLKNRKAAARISRWQLIYVSTVAVFVALVLALLNLTQNA